MLKIKKENLLCIAGIVWLIAGINILRIGIDSFISCFDSNNLFKCILITTGAILIFIGFCFMFKKIVKKHTNRILEYKETKKSIFYFFDKKGYLLMIFMMSLGIGLRSSKLLPTEFFAVFYNGLGFSLSIAGLIFLRNWIKSKIINMTINKIIFLIIAIISLTLGTIGIFFPVLPTVPLYLLAAFSFAKSSDRLHNWFLGTKLYKKHVYPYKKAGGITKKAKIIIIIGVSIQIFIAAYLTRKITLALIIIGLLYLGFLISMLFIVKTIPNQNKKD